MNNVMNSNAISKAENLVGSMVNGSIIKRVKKDRGLMERSNKTEIILEEDNRQVIFG